MERGINIAQYCRLVEDATDAIAAAIIRKTNPVRDDMSTREAYANYGTTWVKSVTRERLAHPHRVGSKVIYSRHELETIRLAQRTYPTLK